MGEANFYYFTCLKTRESSVPSEIMAETLDTVTDTSTSAKKEETDASSSNIKEETDALSSSATPSSAVIDASKVDEKLALFLIDFPNLQKTENGQRIKCRFTGHEMAVTLKAVSQYVNGKKYKNFMKNPTFDWAQYEPHLTPVVTPGSGKKSNNGSVNVGAGGGKNADNLKQLYCQLTQRLINRDPIHVLKHVQGRRYVREKRKYDECQRQGIPYVGIVRSKQKNMKKHADDDGEDDDDDDEAFEKEKKFSTNPEISDSGEDDDEEDADDLADLYPPEEFKSDEFKSAAAKEANGEEPNADDSTDSEDDDFEEGLSSEDEKEQNSSADPGFKGFPFKMASPSSKRKPTHDGKFKRKFKKKRVA